MDTSIDSNRIYYIISYINNNTHHIPETIFPITMENLFVSARTLLNEETINQDEEPIR